MNQVRELKGFKSLRAMNAFHTLMLGLKMTPDYMSLGYEEFFAACEKLDLADQEKLIRKAAVLVPLEEEEIAAMVGFCSDKNGVPYSAENMGNLGPSELHECVVAVAMKVASIKIDLVGEREKKK